MTARELYNNSAELRRLADALHKARMMSPPTCDQCIEIMCKRMGLDFEPEPEDERPKEKEGAIIIPDESTIKHFTSCPD